MQMGALAPAGHGPPSGCRRGSDPTSASRTLLRNRLSSPPATERSSRAPGLESRRLPWLSWLRPQPPASDPAWRAPAGRSASEAAAAPPCRLGCCCVWAQAWGQQKPTFPELSTRTPCARCCAAAPRLTTAARPANRPRRRKDRRRSPAAPTWRRKRRSWPATAGGARRRRNAGRCGARRRRRGLSSVHPQPPRSASSSCSPCRAAASPGRSAASRRSCFAGWRARAWRMRPRTPRFPSAGKHGHAREENYRRRGR
mmetsp:Transcript_1712/g.6688  ORF Transcript_1712/g.6688 Transcript_1712/m.6688 type:complete len:256 (+) Transcript_1712:674-1441(+)